MNEGFRLLSLGRYKEGRDVFARLAQEEDDHYAQVLCARAYYHGYWGLPADWSKARGMLLYCIEAGYAPAIALYMTYFIDDDPDRNQARFAAVYASGNVLAAGLCDLVASERVALDPPQAEQMRLNGRRLVEEAAIGPANNLTSHLACAEAKWSPDLQLRAATWGFADAQHACGQYAQAAAQNYVPSLLKCERLSSFLCGIRLGIGAGRNMMGEWRARFTASTCADRFVMARVASDLAFHIAGIDYRDYYKLERGRHAQRVGTFMWALRGSRFAPRLGRDLIRLLGQKFLCILSGK